MCVCVCGVTVTIQAAVYETTLLDLIFIPFISSHSFLFSCFQAENIMFLELDMTPPNTASLNRSMEAEPSQSPSVDSSPTKDGSVRKSRSW